jgi:hypothetical protein
MLRQMFGSVLAMLAMLFGAMSSAQAAFTVPPEVAQAGVDAALLGVAVLAVLIGIRAFKWIRKAL